MKKWLVAVLPVAVCVLASPASAQSAQEERPTTPMAAPTGAFETTLSAGYTQPFGLVRSGQSIRDLAGPAAGFELGLGYRVLPRLSLSIDGQYAEGTSNVAGAANNVATPVVADVSRGAAAGIDATYHFDPDAPMLDPWLQAGVGYRFLWDVGGEGRPTTLDHGVRLFRLMAGLDFRSTSSIAFAPFFGADLNMFLWERVGGSTTAIADPRLSTFLFGGIQARFDVGGATAAPEVARR